MKETKVVFVKSDFQQTFKETEIRRETGKMKKGLLGGSKPETVKEKTWVPVGVSDSAVDGDQLAINIANAISDLARDGFHSTTMLPITSGSYRYEYREGKIKSRERILGYTEKVSGSSGYSYGYGFSYTEGF